MLTAHYVFQEQFSAFSPSLFNNSNGVLKMAVIYNFDKNQTDVFSVFISLLESDVTWFFGYERHV